MHVLMTADSVGGVFTFVCELAGALRECDVAVTLAVMGPRPSEQQRAEIEALGNVTLDWRPYRLEWMDAPWQDVEAAAQWLLDRARQTKPDIVHLNGYCHAALPWPAPVVVTAHSCVRSWWRAVHHVEPPREWDEYSRRVAAGLQAADVVTAPTQAMLTMLEDEYGSLRRTAVVPNGRSAIAATIRSPQKEPLIFSAGRIWDPAKNVHTLCLAAPLVSWPVSVAGDTSSPDGKPVACQDVDVLGPLPPAAVQDWLARASIYALPARYEPFGLSILEAAASGCALVVGDIASLREIWGDAATYVAPDDTRAVADALQSLIDDPPRRSALAAHAREVAATFSAQRMGEGYGTIYSNLTGRRREVA